MIRHRPLLSFALPGIVTLLATVSGPARATESDSGFQPLWNGKDLSGWRKVGGGATYRVEGDTIVGEVGPGPNTFLRTEKTYGDFILKLQVKLDIPANSGIQYRSHQKNGDGQVYGLQAEIDPSDRAWSGGIYEEGRRGWLQPLTGHPEAQKAFKLEGWNDYEIRAIGPHLQTWVNGVKTGDLLDPMETEGFIALQVHSGKEGRIRWRNLLLKDLGRTPWKPLWDGKSLRGWEKTGGGEWKIEDGVIHGTSSKEELRYGHLLTRRPYGDFAVRLNYRANRGNSGLYFRAEKGGGSGVKGFQVEIDPERDAGGLYETEGRAWVSQPKPEDVKKWYQPNEWNEMSVTAIGRRIVVHVNGQKTAELTDDPGRLRGYLALQLHGGQDMDVAFKDIEIMEIRSSSGQ